MSLEHRHTILDALMTVLDEERALAVLDHRRAIRRPITLHAAKLLAKQFARCIDPNEGADEMIMRGWQGFKPEWIRDRDMTRGTTPRKRTVSDVFGEIASGTWTPQNDDSLPSRH